MLSPGHCGPISVNGKEKQLRSECTDINAVSDFNTKSLQRLFLLRSGDQYQYVHARLPGKHPCYAYEKLYGLDRRSMFLFKKFSWYFRCMTKIIESIRLGVYTREQ